jgi:Flp pilus assembly protein TadG
MPLFRFMQDRRGGVAPMFAIAIIPVFGLVGAAVDYSRANSIRAGMQSAIDATSLAMAKLAPTLTENELKTKSDAYFKAMFNHPDAKNLVITPTYTTAGGSELKISVSGSMDTSFMKLMGFSSLKIGSTSTVKWGNSRLRVALVLDNTGSMLEDNKIGALKTATNGLLTQLKNAATNSADVYVSIIPFAKDVNVGAGNSTASWIDWTAWNEVNGSCSSWWYKNKTDCQGSGKNWTTASHSTWNGCVTDRARSTGPSSNNYDTNVTAPGSSNSSKFSAEQYEACPQAVMPLSNNWTQMTTLVTNMTPDGNTNQGIGLAHGWMSLVGGGPYPTPPSKDPNYTYNDVIILLTDGLNTENRWYTDQSSIDTRQKITCDNVNAANITLYTIQVNTGGDAVSTMLKNCAGTAPGPNVSRKYPDPDKNFVVTSSSGIGTVFNQIGTNLSKLRIAK